jgi:hypothetical protein
MMAQGMIKNMSTENTELTPQEALELKNLEQNYESLVFMRRCPEFKPCKANAETMSELLKTQGLPWETGHLQDIFAKHKKDFELNPPYRPPDAVVEKNENETFLPKWGRLDKKTIAAISLGQHKEWNKHPEFKRQVARVLAGKEQF